ncbi:MAG: cyclopropane-fatty-acyl-phospholipid synthase family protein [Croceibacterium sp.]
MDGEGAPRGHVLLEAGSRFGARPGLAARLFAPGFRKFIERLDAGLENGALRARLPDGTRRRLGGRAPGFQAEIDLADWRALIRLATAGSVGWYQAWEAGEWSSPDPVALFALIAANAASLGETARAKGPWRWAVRALHWLNRNTPAQAARNIHAHYDLGNDFYSAWLDPTLSYSSGYRVADDPLEAAQQRKWGRLAERLGKPATLLEIGCGWGALSGDLAARGARVTAISLSDEQLGWARAHHPAAMFRKQDYREVAGQFEAIVSVEMVEALGREYWPAFMDCIARNLAPGGRAALQFIAMRDDVFESYARNADFIQAYVFPGGLLIKTSEFRALAAERGLAWHDEEEFALDYAETLKAWRLRFDQAAAQRRLPAGFDRRFCDLWRYYLMYCEGGFRGGTVSVRQATLIKR